MCLPNKMHIPNEVERVFFANFTTFLYIIFIHYSTKCNHRFHITTAGPIFIFTFVRFPVGGKK